MKIRFALLFCFLVSSSLFADALTGVITASDGRPLAGVSVSLGDKSVKTTDDGRFTFEVPAGKYEMRVSREGFQPQTVFVSPGNAIAIKLQPAFAENIVVSGIRADQDTPVTKTDVTRAEIRRDYFGQDIPFLLRETPSVNAYAEGGVGGAGYSYIELRGISPTRLNFTFDGVPLADSEDMGAYFVDFPDLAHSLESIQIQRGVGTSTVGTPSFGGSINLESVALSTRPSTDAWFGGGSFGTKMASVGYQTGLFANGLEAYGRVSTQATNGYRDNSGVRQHNFFFSAAKLNDASQWKFTGFAGREAQHESFYASDEATLLANPRDNPLASGPNRDSFGYNLAQLQYLRANLSASVYFQRGYGWYQLDDAKYGLDGLLMGTMLSYSTNWNGVAANFGVHANHFRRDHTLDLVEGGRQYANYGTKDEANGFAKFTYELANWRLYGDAQIRSTNFHYHGDVAIDPIRWTFFNPKIGARDQLSSSSGVYASAGLSQREPTRNDLFQGEDNASIAHDLHAVKPERLLDLEAGWDYRTGRGLLAVNLFAMEFHNEIAATGELSNIGLALRRNVDRSYRRGIEIENGWTFSPALALRGSASLSKNRIKSWTQFFDVYDAAGNIVGSKPLTFANVQPLITPSVIVNESVDYTPVSRVTLTGTGRYVGKSYLDNTNSNAFTAPSFFTLDGTIAYRITPVSRLTLQVNNALDRKHVYPNGYSYQFLTPDGTIDGIRYFYPQATRNFVLTMDVHR